jgi:transposase-like protein
VTKVTRPAAGKDYPRNLHEFLDWFSSEEACYEFLERLRWRDGFVCPHCGVIDGGYWSNTRGRRRCKACRRDTSVTAGTVLDKTRLPLRTWFFAAWYVVNQKNGVSALGLQRVLGFGSYKTAWTWLHKLRRAMVRPGREMIGGPGKTVEVDETFIGGVKTAKHKGRSPSGKAIVAIAVEVHGDSAGKVRMARILNTRKDTLTDFVLENVERGSIVCTDAWTGYDDIGRYRYQHQITNVSASGDPANVSLPHVHRVASLVKRWLLGTHQGGIAREQLVYYLDEYTFRFNRRFSRHRGMLFYRLMEGAVTTAPQPFESIKS